MRGHHDISVKFMRSVLGLTEFIWVYEAADIRRESTVNLAVFKWDMAH